MMYVSREWLYDYVFNMNDDQFEEDFIKEIMLKLKVKKDLVRAMAMKTVIDETIEEIQKMKGMKNDD